MQIRIRVTVTLIPVRGVVGGDGQAAGGVKDKSGTFLIKCLRGGITR